MEIRQMHAWDHDKIIALMKQMPDFFSPETIEYAQGIIASLQWYTAYANEDLLWFIAFGRQDQETMKIYRIAVEKGSQGAGLGTRLMDESEKSTRLQWMQYVELLTLWDHPDYPGYERTRWFYERRWYHKTASYKEHDIELLTMTKDMTD